MAIDGHHVQFADAPQGKKSFELQIAAAVLGPDNQVVTQTNQTFTDAMTPEETRELSGSGLIYDLDLDSPKPGRYNARVAVWDAYSNRTASASQFVEIPDFNGRVPQLSSLQLSASEATWRTGAIELGNGITRSFRQGSTLTYDCRLFGAGIDPRSGRPEIEVQVLLFRDAGEIFKGPLIPLKIADGNTGEPTEIQGEIVTRSAGAGRLCLGTDCVRPIWRTPAHRITVD